MSIKEDILKARSYIVFIVGLGIAFSLVHFIESRSPVTNGSATLKIPERVEIKESTNIPERQAPRPLTETELVWAKTAWRYFENNTRPETGLTNSVDGYNASTLWDTSSYLLALIASERTHIISRKEFDQRMGKVLDSLHKMPLFDQKLPNKSYNTITLAMVDYGNNASTEGIGWSAIDIGRVLVPFNILAWNYPEHTPAVRQVISAWQFQALLHQGELMGAHRNQKKSIEKPQEGRLGYEQYAAKAFTLLGLDVNAAVDYRRHLDFISLYGIPVGIDTRDPAHFGAQNFVVSEPYVLDGIEFGFDSTSRELAWRVYSAQYERYRHTGTLTAVSEDHIDAPPYFVYNTLYSGGKEWATITETGKDASAFRSLSIKAVFGWHALYRTPYTEKMLNAIAGLSDPQKGWYTGRYEATGKTNTSINANTNAIILESLAYIQDGSLLKL
jgi:hypothetical protein